jgi:hypothetical protein
MMLQHEHLELVNGFLITKTSGDGSKWSRQLFYGYQDIQDVVKQSYRHF